MSTNEERLEARLKIFKKKYPLWKSGGAAKRAFYKLNVDDSLLKTMLEAISNQLLEKALLKQIGAFVAAWKHPSTWLNQECWEDVVILDEKLLREHYGRPAETKRGDLLSEKSWEEQIGEAKNEFDPFQ